MLAFFFGGLVFGNLNFLPVFVVCFKCLFKFSLTLCINYSKPFSGSAAAFLLGIIVNLLMFTANIISLAQSSLALLHVAMALFHLAFFVYSLNLMTAAPMRRHGPLAVGPHGNAYFILVWRAALFIVLEMAAAQPSVAEHGPRHQVLLSTLLHSSLARSAPSQLRLLRSFNLLVSVLFLLFVALDSLLPLLLKIGLLFELLLDSGLHLFLALEFLSKHFLHFFALLLSVYLLFVEDFLPATERLLAYLLFVLVALIVR